MQNSENKVNIIFTQGVYTRSTILKACYSFIERWYFQLDLVEEKIVVSIEPKRTNEFTAAEIENEFYNELLLQEMRNQVSSDSKNIRELILARALYSAYMEESEQSIFEDANLYNIDNIAKDVFTNDK